MTIKELKKGEHDYSYTNEELIFIFKYFKKNYSIDYMWWSKKTGVCSKTIYRILYGETTRTNSRTRNKITELARKMINKIA